jgi:hypothetical protein
MSSFFLRPSRKEIVMIRSISVALLAYGLGIGMLGCQSPNDNGNSGSDYGQTVYSNQNNGGSTGSSDRGTNGATKSNPSGAESGPTGGTGSGTP